MFRPGADAVRFRSTFGRDGVPQNLSVGALRVIGAGAVVAKQVPSDVLVMGVQARW